MFPWRARNLRTWWGWLEGGGEPATVVAGGRIGGVEAGQDADHRAADQVTAGRRVERRTSISFAPIRRGAVVGRGSAVGCRQGVEERVQGGRAIARVEGGPGVGSDAGLGQTDPG